MMEVVGKSLPRRDAWDKVTGRTRFLADSYPNDAWSGAALRSPVAHGRLLRIERDDSFDWSGVVVVTAAGLPGPNLVAMVREDLPLLVEGDIRFHGQPLALVAAPDAAVLQAALAALHPVIEELPAVLGIDEALQDSQVIWGEDNIIADYTIAPPDETAFAAALAGADRIIEGVYRTGYQEHVYLEPQGVVATPRPDGGVEILGSMQCPFYVLNALARGLDMTREQIIVRQSPTGGAFGGKEDYPSVLALQAAVLALRSSRPVAMIYDRHEDIIGSTKRHPSRTRHRTGVMNDGTLVAADIDVTLDAGAFTTLSPVVLSRAILHAAGSYHIPHVRIRGRAVATNTPPNGAFRGFGVPQGIFAAERQMDRIARELGLDTVEIRRRNILKPGHVLPHGQIMTEGDTAAELVLERALELSEFWRRRAELDASNKRAENRVRRGIGISLVHHGAGFTGDGEDRIAAEVAVRGEADGKVTILCSSVEMGQGAETVLPAMAAEALGLPLESIRYHQPDTGAVPDSGPTVASRTTMVVGKVLIRACRNLVEAAREFGGDLPSVLAARAAAGSPLIGNARYEPDPDLSWDQAHHRGDAYQGYSWCATVVEAAVDTDTCEVHPERATVVVEIGRAINPVLCVGQVEGGMLQGLAWGYLEEIKLDRGRYLNDRLSTYLIPTSLDAPEFTVELAAQPSPRGGYGAKGLGELPMNGGAPALAAALEHALGPVPDEIPLTPEKLLANLLDRPPEARS